MTRAPKKGHAGIVTGGDRSPVKMPAFLLIDFCIENSAWEWMKDKTPTIYIDSLLCWEMLDMESNWILIKLRDENSVTGARKVYLWSRFAPKKAKFWVKLQNVFWW